MEDKSDKGESYQLNTYPKKYSPIHTHKHIAKLSGDGAILTFSLPPWDVVNELNAVLVGDNE